MPRKYTVPADPMGDLEIEIHKIQAVAELLIVAHDSQESEHVAYLVGQLPQHAGQAWKAFEALHEQRKAERPEPEPAQPPKPPSPRMKAAIRRLMEISEQERDNDD